jgi:hypothetical protein
MQYAKNIGVATLGVLRQIDIWFNALLFGDPRMTLSGRMGRDIKANRCVLCKGICWMLNLIDKNHCAEADANEAQYGKDQITGD